MAKPRGERIASTSATEKDVARLISRVAELEAESDELRETQRMLAGLMRNLPGMSYRCRNDAEWTMEFVSDGCISLTGYYPDDIVDNRRIAYGKLIQPDDRDRVWREVQAALRRKRYFRLRYRITRADGETRWAWEQGCGVFAKGGQLLAIEGFVMDVTERMRAEEALRRSEEKFRSLYCAMSEAVCIHELLYDEKGAVQDYRIVDVNPAYERITGLKRTETVGRTAKDLYATDNPAHLPVHTRVAADGKALTFESFFEDSGKYFNVSVFSLGECKTASVFFDITERKQAEAALRAGEERFRELFRQMNTGVMVYKVVGDAEDFIIKDVNRAGEKIDSVRKRDVVGKPVREVFPGVGQFGILEVFERVWRSGQPERRSTALYEDERISGWRENYVYRLPSGEIVSLFDDVTERRLMENKILAKQRMEAIGTLAGGIANDFSNVLGLMTGHTSTLMEHLTPNSLAYETAQRLLESERHAGRLTKRLLSVARASDVRGETRIEPVVLTSTVRETVALIEHAFSEKAITCRVRNAEAMPTVLADETQLRDVLMNLLLNAVKALAPGGLIRIDAETRTLAEPDVRHNPDARPGEYVVLRFRDNGCGVAKAVIDRIFDPFFTTDDSGASMGLGLSIVQSSVQRWGGWVRVRSREGIGSSFRLFIPGVTTEAGQGEAAGASSGGGVVLVVDDQEDCRTWLSKLLKGAGFEVIEAGNGKDAAVLFRKHADSIAVSLVDVVMPGQDGKAVLEAILGVDPTAQVVMMSGFSQDYVRGYLERGAWAFLQKPFMAEQLLDTITGLIRREERDRADRA